MLQRIHNALGWITINNKTLKDNCNIKQASSPTIKQYFQNIVIQKYENTYSGNANLRLSFDWHTVNLHTPTNNTSIISKKQ